MRTVSATLATLQKAATRLPYIKLTFSQGATEYSYTTAQNRILYIRHLEEPYEHSAVMILVNNTRDLPDLTGYKCLVDYGLTSASVNYLPTPNGPAPLWVHGQQHISKSTGRGVYTVLVLQGVWRRLAEGNVIDSLVNTPGYPWWESDYSASGYTPYDIIEKVLEGEDFDLLPLGIHNDSIIDTLEPDLYVNSTSYEAPREVIYRLLNMTKCFMRAERALPSEYLENNTMIEGFLSSLQNPAHRMLYAQGRWWVFYVERTTSDNLYFTSSPDRVAWAAKTQIATGNNVYHPDCDVVLDGTNVHIAFAQAVGTHDHVSYIKGALSTAGTITWEAEQLIYDSGVSTYQGPQTVAINLDSDGYPTVFWSCRDKTKAGYRNWIVERSTTSNGVWTAAGRTTLQSAPLVLDAPYSVHLCASNEGDLVALWGRPNNIAWPTDCGLYSAYRDSSYTWASAEKLYDLASYNTWSAVEYMDNGDALIVYQGTDYHIEFAFYDSYGTGVYGEDTLNTNLSSIVYPSVSMYDSYPMAVVVWNSALHWYYKEFSYYSGWGDTTDWATIASLYATDEWTMPRIMPAAELSVCYATVAEIMKFLYIPTSYVSPLVKFRIIYPPAWTSFHATYTSDRPDATYHQFKEFEWYDHLFLPNKVNVAYGEDAEGNFTGQGTYTLDNSHNNEYPNVTQYATAATITAVGDANTRAEVIARRAWMETILGRVRVPHDSGLEQYDYVRVRNKRGGLYYLDYPTALWSTDADIGKVCVVGSLEHIYSPYERVYDLIITLNGIQTSMQTYDLATKKAKEKEVVIPDINIPEDFFKDWEGIPAPTVTSAKPFKPILDPVKYGGAPMAWNVALDLFTGGGQVRRDITEQAIDWAKQFGQLEKPEGFDEWLAGAGGSLL